MQERCLYIGSTNRAKITQLSSVLAPAGIRVHALDPATLPVVPEDSAEVVDNARAKATAFATAASCPVLAMDAGLQFPDLGAAFQPGTRVRRFVSDSERPDDDLVLDHYVRLCVGHGGRIRARWSYGFAIGLPDGRCFTEELAVERHMVCPPSPVLRAGYPLDSLQQEPTTGRYLSELSPAEAQRMWHSTIGAVLMTFVGDTVGRVGEDQLTRGYLPSP